MDPNARKNKWRGATREVLNAIEDGQFDGRKFSPLDIREWLQAKHPEISTPPASASQIATQRAHKRGLIQWIGKGIYYRGFPKAEETSISVPSSTLPNPPAQYQGLLFDGEELLVSIEHKTWRFTHSEWQAISRMIHGATKFFTNGEAK